MEVVEHVAALRREGRLLAEAAARTDLGVAVPTCPEWRMRDLVRHIGGVHRWAAAYVAGSRTQPMSEEEEAEIMAPPDDHALIDWFREGHAHLIHELETAAPDVACWTFLAAPSPRAFWARRQAHETAIHRADAESPGTTITPFPPAFAADGIDELLTCFITRPGGRLRTDPPRILHVGATDVAANWLVRIGPNQRVVSRQAGDADCSVRGRACQLYLMLWNRRPPTGLQVRGDPALLDLWRHSVRVRWS
ncbi:MAG TPA: maleylpyruvate isomerase family mycothiol-dependent enzyme [Actinomycetes bacterium]|jgi:uncharacterized protein (TIGR03083 family)|nr:maleylpyruvate isomerase family mycothiol-dependent enzyme [Actinomycetes bacterium]